jgi:hypothetical protein
MGFFNRKLNKLKQWDNERHIYLYKDGKKTLLEDDIRGNFMYVIEFRNAKNTYVKVGGTVSPMGRYSPYNTSHVGPIMHLFEINGDHNPKRPYVTFEKEFLKLHKNRLIESEKFCMTPKKAIKSVRKLVELGF